MEASNFKYNFESSLSRIDEILNAPNDSFEESDSIVDRAKLTVQKTEVETYIKQI